MTAPSHRSEHTGSASADRVQDNVRSLVNDVKELIRRVVSLEARNGATGLSVVELPDAAHTLSSSHAAGAFWLFTGTLTAARTIIIPRAKVDAGSYTRQVYNFTTGGFTLTLANEDGSLPVAATTGAMMIVSTLYGPEKWF